MKQMEVIEKRIGESTFFLKPFPAFAAAHISGELTATITPLLGGISALLGNSKDANGAEVLEMDVETVLPVLSEAFSGLSGEKIEQLMRKLLIDNRNISVECEATGGNLKILTYDLANEVFCGELQDMYILCYEVIKLNFGGFFKKLGARFGNLQEVIQKVTPSTANGESLI